MANKKLWLGMLAITLTLLSTMILSSCATDVASVKAPYWNKQPIKPISHDYIILGTVRLEKDWFGILGITMTRWGIDSYVYQRGGVLYSDLLDEARRLYPEADAVIDVKVDYMGTFFGTFYAQRKDILTGIAIKYIREPKN